MPYVIVGICINDAACVRACPVDAIHPAPHEPGFASADMLYIDPDTCINCNACAEACPVRAIMPADRLPVHFARYRAINEQFFRSRQE